MISICAFAQRNVDLSLAMSSPDSTTTIVGSHTFNFTATITNHGSDVIKTTDTLVFAFIMDGATSYTNVIYSGKTYQELASAISSPIASGASANINVPLSLASFPTAGPHSLCAIAIDLNRSTTDSVHDANLTNNKVCTNIIFQMPTSVYGAVESSSEATIYPNPAMSVVNIKLDLQFAQHVIITLVDMYGRTIYSADNGTVSAGTSILHIDTHNIPDGTYLYSIQTDAHTDYGKLIVIH